MNKYIEVWCDGNCKNNQAKDKSLTIGGRAYILIFGDKYKEYSFAERNTTNNVQELTALIEALSDLKRYDIPLKIFPDSMYMINSLTTWIYGWKKNGWMTKEKEPVKNKELIVKLDGLLSKFNKWEISHVDGHANIKYNERCDELANLAIKALLDKETCTK